MPRNHPQALAQSRFPELDALRGLAVLLMVIYHTAFDLDYFWGWPVLQSLGIGGWILARTSAILFLLIAGICSTISWERKTPQSTEPSCSSACAMQLRNSSRQRERDGEVRTWSISYHWRKVLRRFAVLAGAAAIVSFATWLIAPEDFVKFGILHLFALSTILLPLFARLKHWNVFIGILIITVPTLPTVLTLPTVPAILLGFPPETFSSLDYFPLIPWFGVILIGTAIGHILYIQHPNWRNLSSIFNSQFSILHFVGRHSLLIYLLHQPILLALLFLLLKPPSSY